MLLGNGTTPPVFTPAAGSPFAAGDNCFAVAIANIDADTVPDLVVANAGSNSVSLLLGTGTGAFGAPINFTVGTEPRDVKVADLNNDGAKDIIVVNYNAGQPTTENVSILMGVVGGTGAGTFAAHAPVATGAGSSSVAVTNLDANATLRCWRRRGRPVATAPKSPRHCP